VFENRVLRKIWAKRDAVIGGVKRTTQRVTYDVYSSPNIIGVIKSRRTSWVRHVARMGDRRCAYGVLVVKREGKRPLGKSRSR
jgi:hypothetical protein